jgi:hypothetical protein
MSSSSCKLSADSDLFRQAVLSAQEGSQELTEGEESRSRQQLEALTDDKTPRKWWKFRRTFLMADWDLGAR